MLRTPDVEIARRAAAAGAIILTKDGDFSRLGTLNPPPRVIWIRIGNASNAELRDRLEQTLSAALDELDRGETLVQI
jgi:predicted nuclease of predicted toxin-antitoxin system